MSKKLLFLTSFILVLGLVFANVTSAYVIEVPVADGSDDAEEDVGGSAGFEIDLTSTDLEFMYDNDTSDPLDEQVVGIRFVDVQIPKGATIVSAAVRFDADDVDDPEHVGEAYVIIEGELTPNPDTFENTPANITARSKTVAQVPWGPAHWAVQHEKYFTPDISSIIEEIINQDGWQAGNALVLVFSQDPANPSTGVLEAESFTDNATDNIDRRPTLQIEFSYSGAMSPDPADGAIDVKSTPVLSWTAPDDAWKHDLYLGTDADLVAAGDASVYQGELTEASFAVDVNEPLSRGITYYWKVDVTTGTARESQFNPGSVWSFRVVDENTESWLAAAEADSPSYLDTYVEDGVYDIGALSGDITYEFVVLSNPDETVPSMCLIGRRNYGDTTVGLKYEQWNNTGTYGATIFGVVDLDFGIPTSPGEYTHLTFISSEDAGTCALYVNGVYQASVDRAITLSGLVGIGYLAEAEDGSAFADDFDGTIFGVAIYDVALTDEQIAAHSESYFTPFEEIEPTNPGAEGLVAHYAFENDANDSSANALHGTLVGDPVFAEGPAGYGMALDFDGDGDYVDCSNNALFSITDAFSLSVWINWRTPTVDWQTVIAKGDNAWRLARNGGGQTIDFGFTDGGPRGWLSVATASEVPLGEWHHVTATIDMIDGAKIYLDGVLEGTNPDTGGITQGDYPVYIGENAQAANRFWDGLIDEVMIYSRVLSEAEILYVAGKRATPVDPGSANLLALWPCDEGEGAVVSDASGNGRDGTVVFGDPVWVEGIHGKAVELVGPTLVEAPPLGMELTEATMAGWILPYGPQPDWSSIIMHRGAGLAHGFNVILPGYQLAYHWNDDSNSWSFRGGDNIAEDDWTFAAVTVDAEKAVFYVNGEKGSVNEIAHGPAMWDNNIYLGGDGADNWIARRMVGALDDVAMYDRALSAGEISYLAGHRPAPVAPGTEGLVASYTFDVDASDASGNGYNGTLLGDAAVLDGVLVLDGDGDAVDVPTIGSDFTELTYSMYVYPTEDLVPLQFSGGMNSNNWAAGAVHLKMNYGVVNVGINGLAGGDLAGTTIVEPDKWSHIALTVSETMVAIYLNGEVEDSRALDAPLAGLVLGDAAIGAWNNGGTAIQREMAGQMDNVLIYSRGLSVGEVRYLAGYRATPVDPGTRGLIAYYALENDVLDGSGNELHGTIVGEPTYVEGPAGYGTAMAFDGVDDYVDFGNDARFDITEQVSLAVWVNANDMLNGEHNPWLGKGDHCYAIKHQSGNYLEFFIYDGGWHSTVFRDYDESMNGEWHHTAGTYDGSELKFYLDGDLSATLAHEGSIETREHPVTMGTNSEAGGRFYDGALDEGVIYRRALSDGEVRYLAGYREETGEGDPSLVIYYTFDEVGDIVPDKSGKGHDGVVVGDVSADPEGVLVGAGKFSNGAYLDLDGPNFAAEDIPTSGMTLAAWIKCENTGDHHAIFNARASDQTWLVHPEARSNGEFRWLLRSYGGTTMFDIRAGAVTWDEWLHFAGTYDKASGKAALCINGEMVSEVDVATPDDIAGDWGMGARVGKNIDDARPFTGLMDEFRMYTRALSQEEIAGL